MQIEQKTLQASAAQATSKTSDDVPILSRAGQVFLDVTVQVGTTLDVVVEQKDVVSGKYFVLATFTQATGVTQESKDVDRIDSGVLRARGTQVGGSFTYSVGFSGKEGVQD